MTDSKRQEILDDMERIKFFESVRFMVIFAAAFGSVLAVLDYWLG